jgi:hypothetical protein
LSTYPDGLFLITHVEVNTADPVGHHVFVIPQSLSGKDSGRTVSRFWRRSLRTFLLQAINDRIRLRSRREFGLRGSVAGPRRAIPD